MNIWKILETEPTNDKRSIKTAYRQKLKEINPENSPEEFMKLREAYEQALEWQDTELNQIETEDGENPVVRWSEKLFLLYSNNRLRFCAKEWGKLFEDDVCQSLDTRDDAGKSFLEFFSENMNISRDVIGKADDAFHFSEKIEELTEWFGSSFVEYLVYYRMKEKEFPAHEYFLADIRENADYEAYIEGVHHLYRAYEADDKNAAYRIIGELDGSGIRHPYVETKRAWIVGEDKKQVYDIFHNIEERWGEYAEAILTKGEFLFQDGRFEEAEKCFRRTLELEDNYEKALFLLILALKEQRKYVQAREVIVNVKDPNVRIRYAGFLGELEEAIICELESELQKGVLSEEDIYSLALSYAGRGRIKETEKTIGLLDGKEEWEIKIHRLKGFLLEGEKEWEKTFESSEYFIRRLEKEPINEEICRYFAEAYMMRGRMLLHMKKKNAGIESMNKAIEYGNNAELYIFQKVSILMGYQLYELAADVFSELLRMNPRNIMYRFGRGKCFFEVGLLQEAHEDFEYICMLEENDILAYIYIMKIYLQAEMWEDAEEIFALFEQKEWNTDSVELLKGLYEEARGNYKKAEKILEKLLGNYDSERSDLEHVGEVYLHLAKISVERGKRGFTVFEYLNKGIELEPEYIPLLEKRWEMNELFEDSQDVEADVKKILDISPYHAKANEKMSDVYEEAGQLEKAKEYMNVRQEKTVENYLNNAVNEIQGGRYEEAWQNICLAESYNSDEIGIHAVKALYYSTVGEDEKVITEYEKYMEEGDTSFYAEIAYANCHLGNYDKARELCLRMIGNGDKEQAYEMLYELELECGNYKEAQKYLKEWNAERKKTILNYRFQVNSARICLAKKEYIKAKLLLDETELFDVEGNQVLSSLLLYQGKEKKALKILKQGLKDWPERVELYYYAALACRVMGENRMAEEYAKKGLVILEKDDRIGLQMKMIYKQKGALYALMGDYESARTCLEKALELPLCSECMQCQCHEVYLQMALLYRLLEDNKKCKEYLERAGQIKDNDRDYIGLSKLMEKNKI